MASEGFEKKYWALFEELKANPPKNFTLERSAIYEDDGDHPFDFTDLECLFTANVLKEIPAGSLLDVGSYRHFILGLVSKYDVTSLDVRKKDVEGLKTMVCDVKDLKVESDSFDIVTSLCSLEHFGMTRYGDKFDLNADKKGFNEMVRVLKPGGTLIFSTAICKGSAKYYHNAHRIYTYGMIQAFCKGLERVDEKFISLFKNKYTSLSRVSKDIDFYLGVWKKSST